MKKQLFLLFICLAILGVSHGKEKLFSNSPANHNVFARVYFSNEVPILGIATESKELFIKSEGGYAYLVIDNHPNNFSYDQVQLKVYKTVNGSYQSYDNKTYTISTSNY